MLEVPNGGGRPINRSKSWGEDQRQKNTEDKSKNWYMKGGYDAPLFVPHTPGEVVGQEDERLGGRK